MSAARGRGERGAVAVIYALLAVVLVGMAAMAVDLGNGIARKSDVQGQADFAALAAASQLGADMSGTVAAAVVNEVRDQLNANRPLNDDGTCRDAAPCVTSADLTDGNLANGEVRYCSGTSPAGCRKSGLQVIGPAANVDFGFAGVFGVDDVDVQGNATVGLFSPLGVMPVYAVPGCDLGNQTITDPPTGQTGPLTIPTLAYDADTNDTTLDPTSTSPDQVPLDTLGGASATFGLGNGGKWGNVTNVGFFPSDGSAAVIIDSFTHGTTTHTPLNPLTANSGTVTVTLPAAVQSSQQVWYIRVLGDKTTGTGPSQVVTQAWSDKTEAPTLRVGDPPLECAGTPSDGNFGVIKLERTDVTSVNDQLALNMATKLQEPTTLTTHADANATGLCADGIDGAKVSELPNPGQQEGTNCVDTDTGLPASATTAGLVTGVAGEPGRLVGHPTATGCDPTGGSSDRAMTFGNGSNATTYQVNNDTLTCFLDNGTTSLQDITMDSYCPGTNNTCPVLDPAIFESPRFFFVPVLAVTPVSGGSDRYSIIDFRPAFITDETVTTATIKGTHTATSDNGLTQDGDSIRTVKVIFFSIKALPNNTNGQVTTYLGVGPKIIRLID